LALVETDKVTVDIKAERDGILIKQLGNVDDTVEVGAGLYILDTDVQNVESAVLETNMSEVNEALDAIKAGEEIIEQEPISKTTTRIPSIHFLGKDGWKARLTATDSSSSVAAPTASATTILKSDKPNSPTSITQIQYKPMEGRPLITEEEMEALILGGALEAPDVRTLISEDGLKSVAFVGGKITTAGPRGVWLAA
jgi:pyruvate/2-oxoglutarate dehydrogenase complex dihydrolipoamide acyltransferase (E2) component